MTLREAYTYILGLLDGFSVFKDINDDFAQILGEMRLGPDDTPGDPAFVSDWKDAVRKVTGEESLNETQALAAGVNFLTFFKDAHHFDLKEPIQFLQDKLMAYNVSSETWRQNQR